MRDQTTAQAVKEILEATLRQKFQHDMQAKIQWLHTRIQTFEAQTTKQAAQQILAELQQP